MAQGSGERSDSDLDGSTGMGGISLRQLPHPTAVELACLEACLSCLS